MCVCGETRPAETSVWVEIRSVTVAELHSEQLCHKSNFQRKDGPSLKPELSFLPPPSLSLIPSLFSLLCPHQSQMQFFPCVFYTPHFTPPPNPLSFFPSASSRSHCSPAFPALCTASLLPNKNSICLIKRLHLPPSSLRKAPLGEGGILPHLLIGLGKSRSVVLVSSLYLQYLHTQTFLYTIQFNSQVNIKAGGTLLTCTCLLRRSMWIHWAPTRLLCRSYVQELLVHTDRAAVGILAARRPPWTPSTCHLQGQKKKKQRPNVSLSKKKKKKRHVQYKLPARENVC